ncbi:prohead protease/major capsid protein fusion protein [Pyxidicoccus xibeiensis]|uniref:prohead protease/major capsid protein fusion protein n=1 Tax=Pyxidicoccus xibeiensis TaxID=2906759 RepID=UPI0020A70DBC|nr:prohead protease/major capsid protein fusion protein [Pyxidicoccus xibeiensis]MCP3137540.1 Mu-like prophage major head subunit gpT family protein [Pyxidicoccus xibeiensis]
MPPLTVRGSFVPGTVNREARTVELTWTTGARVLRHTWSDGTFYEELSLDPAHVHLDRLRNGAPFLADHASWSVGAVRGVVESASVTAGEGRALVRFVRAGVDEEADELFEKIADGVCTKVSVGYRVHKMEKVADSDDGTPVYRAISWTPYEVSAVAIGADDGAGFRSASPVQTNPCEVITRGDSPHEETAMPQNNPSNDIITAERTRAATITSLVSRNALPAELADKLIREGTNMDAARAVILEALATRSDGHGGPGQVPSGAVERGNSHGALNDMARNMGAALAQRVGVKANIPEGAAQYARLGIVDMARMCLEARGVRTSLMGKSQIVQRAYSTTSEFPALLGEAGNRSLMDGYAAYPSGIRQVSRAGSLVDFRAKSLLKLSEAPELLKVSEHGEYKHGSMTSTKESYRLETFGRIFSLTRQAILNDDLGSFDMIRKFGRAAAELEASTLVALLVSNPLMSDGLAVFHASRGNLDASGSIISVASIGEAVRAMRTQKCLGSNIPANIAPKFLVVPAALEVVALQHVASINAAQSSHVNPFGGTGRLEVLVDPRLDAVSATAWYLASDPNETPAIEHSHLDGQNGPEIIEHVGHAVDGTAWKCRLDFGAAIIDAAGLYKNNGA